MNSILMLKKKIKHSILWTVGCSWCTFPYEVKKQTKSDLEHVYIPKKVKLRNPKIDYTSIEFHNGRMDTETFF